MFTKVNRLSLQVTIYRYKSEVLDDKNQQQK